MYRFFFKWDEKIRRSYSALYEAKGSSYTPKIDLSNGYSWIAWIDRLTDGNPTLDDKIWKKNYLDCLNRFAYWLKKDKYIEEINDIERKKYKS